MTKLQELEVNIITNGECESKWGPDSVNAGHVCVFDARDERAIGGACNVRMIESRTARKPIFGVFDQGRHKPGCTTTEDG